MTKEEYKVLKDLSDNRIGVDTAEALLNKYATRREQEAFDAARKAKAMYDDSGNFHVMVQTYPSFKDWKEAAK